MEREFDISAIENEIRIRLETEANTKGMESLRQEIKTRWEKEDLHWEKIDLRLDKIESELSLYKFSLRIVKAVGLTAAAFLAFKFGDIKQIWSNF